MSLGERLSELIKEKGVTLYQVAMKTGISQASLSRITKNNTAKMTTHNIEVLAGYFKVDAGWLSTGIGDRGADVPIIDQTDPEIINQRNQAKIEMLKEMVDKQSAKIEELIRENARLHYLNNGK